MQTRLVRRRFLNKLSMALVDLPKVNDLVPLVEKFFDEKLFR